MTALVYCDGSYRPGESVGQTGWVIAVLSEPPLIARGGSGPRKDLVGSERVEWRAVFDALSWLALVKSVGTVVIRSDRKDVVWAINETGGSDAGKAYAKSLRGQYPQWEISAGWVPREHNRDADRQSRSMR